MATVTPTALPVVDQLDLDNGAVRKHGTQIMAIADLSVAAPTEFFENVVDGGGATIGQIPKVLPTGFRSLGLVTTDGIQESTSVSTSSVSSAQTTSSTRTDTDSETTTLQVTLQEMNGWIKAFANDLPVSQWPVDKDAAWRFKTGKTPEKPNFRVLILTQDGVGREAVYRVEFAFNARVTDKGDRSLSRADEERVQRTLELFPDPKTGYIKDEMQTARPAIV